jgi:hypothetical protein
MNPTKTWGELRWYGRISSSCTSQLLCWMFSLKYTFGSTHYWFLTEEKNTSFHTKLKIYSCIIGRENSAVTSWRRIDGRRLPCLLNRIYCVWINQSSVYLRRTNNNHKLYKDWSNISRINVHKRHGLEFLPGYC